MVTVSWVMPFAGSIVICWKNWLFTETRDRAQAGEVLFTTLENAKENGLNPEKHIRHRVLLHEQALKNGF